MKKLDAEEFIDFIEGIQSASESEASEESDKICLKPGFWTYKRSAKFCISRRSAS